MRGVPDPPLNLTATPTRVERLERLSDDKDASLYVKRDDTTAGIAHGNKARKLEFLLNDALEEGADMVVTCGGLQSNHCRTTAVLAPRLGLDAHLVLLGEEPQSYDGNFLVSRLAGASAEYVPMAELSGSLEDELEETAERLRDKGRKPYVVPLGGSSPRGSVSYVHAYEEIRRQAESEGISFDKIVTAVGSGGTCAGLVAGSLYADDEVDVVGVDVTPYGAAYQEQSVAEKVMGISELIDRGQLEIERVDEAVDVVSGYVGPGYGEPSEEDIETVVEVGRKEGLILDTTYTAKAFRYFLETVEAGETALFLHTGGSYGVFPHSTKLTEGIRAHERGH